MITEIRTVGVVGAGTMGQGIAEACAVSGYSVVLHDANAQALDRAVNSVKDSFKTQVAKNRITEDSAANALSRIKPSTAVDDVRADLVIEAIIEDLPAKRNLFSVLEKVNGAETIFASNTSSISITQIAKGLPSPERLAGLHFFNPAPVMKLVEVIKGATTRPSTIDILSSFVLSLNKKPVMANDAPGFIVNRVARHYYVESLKVLDEGIASHEEVDKLMKSSGFRLGPFELMDLIGIDINFAVTNSLYHAFHQDPKFRPSRIQQQKIDAGELGRKSGKGFYVYTSK